MEGRKTYTAYEVARMLGVSEATVYKLCREGDMPCLRLGKRVVIPQNWLTTALESAAECRQNRRQPRFDGDATAPLLQSLRGKDGHRKKDWS